MPTAEVVCAVTRVQVLVKVHRNDIANGFLQQQLLHFLSLRSVAGVEGHSNSLAAFLLCVQDRLTLLFIGAQRLFGHYVCAQFQPANDVTVVSAIHGSHHHRIGTSFLNHPVEVHEGGGADPNQLLGRFDALAVDIA